MYITGKFPTVTTPVSISIILPAFNEVKNLAGVVTDAVAILGEKEMDFEIIIVNDGSTDGTADLCFKLEQSFKPHVRAVHLSSNRGYGAALQAGFVQAGKALVFFTDSDGQFHFESIFPFLEAAPGCDAVIGYRSHRQDPWFRKLNSKLGNLLARFILGVKVRDINCAFKLMRRESLQKLPLKSCGAMINTELLVHARLAEWKIRQLAVVHYPRKHGIPTGAKPSVIWKTFQEYFTLRKTLSKYKSKLETRSCET